MATYNDVRFSCRCGRFLADSAIRHTDHRDDSRYYGIRTEVEWDCSRCGTVEGEEWEPQIVVTATRPILPDGHCWCGGEVGPRVPGDERGLGCLEDINHG